MAAVSVQIEDAVIAALQPLKALGLDGLAAFSGEVDEELTDIRLLFNGRFPSIGVAVERGRFRSISVAKRRFLKEQSVEIYVLGASLRSREEVRRDDVTGGDVSVTRLIELVHEKLIGFVPAIAGVTTLIPVSEDPIVRAPDMQLWRVTYTCDVDANYVRAAAGPLTSILGRHNLPDSERLLASGVGDAFTVAGGVVTLTDAAGVFQVAHVGELIVIAGATTAANNGTFTITAVPAANQIRWANAGGVAEVFPGTWKIKAPPLAISLAGA